MAEDQEQVGDNYTTHDYYSLQANQEKRSQREAVAFEELDCCSSSTTKITTKKPKKNDQLQYTLVIGKRCIYTRPKSIVTTMMTTTTTTTTTLTSLREREEQELGGDNYSTTDHEYSLKANQKKRWHREAVACEELGRYSSSSTTKIPTQKPKIHHHRLPYTLVIGKRRIYTRPKNIVTTTAAAATATTIYHNCFYKSKGNNVGEVLNHALQETSLPSIRR